MRNDVEKFSASTDLTTTRIDSAIFMLVENGRAIKKADGKGNEFIDDIQALYAHGGGLLS